MIPTPNDDYVDQGLALFTSQFSAAAAPQLRAQTASYLAECQDFENAFWDVFNLRLLASVRVYSPLAGGFNVTNGAPLALAYNDQADYIFVGALLTFASQPGVQYTVTGVFNGGVAIELSPTYSGPSAVGTGATQPLTNTILDIYGNLVGQKRLGLDDLDFLSILYLRIAVNRSGGRQADWSNLAGILLRTSGGPIAYFESGTGGTGESSAFYFGVWDMTLNPVVVASVLADATPDGEGPNCFAWSTWPDGADFAASSVYDNPPDGSVMFTSILGTALSTAGNIVPGSMAFESEELGFGSVYDPTVGGLMVAASAL